MAKRTLGLGNKARSKKQKVELENNQTEDSNQLTVELPEEIDENDELGQLKGLYTSYLNDKPNELILNGIIHECDRILRNDHEELPSVFYSIYGKSLNELSQFQIEDIKEAKKYIEAGLERIEDGLKKYPNDIDLLFAKSKVLLNDTLLNVSELTIESEKDNDRTNKKLDDALKSYELAELKSKEIDDYHYFNEETLSILQDFDDLLEVVDNFGKEQKQANEEDKEDDDEDEEDGEEVELSQDHPLYNIKTNDDYNHWWRDHTLIFLNNLTKSNQSSSLYKQINKLLGQSYLQEAEIPTNAFTSLTYDDDYQGIEELYGFTKDEAQKVSKELMNKALKYLNNAKDEEEPDSWAAIAEAQIQFGNLFEVDSKEQEELYKEAEELLTKANNVTNGLYEDILQNLTN